MQQGIKLQRVSGLAGVDCRAWNRLAGGNPFMRYEFLRALEDTGCVGAGTAWRAAHLLATDENGLCGALPLYIKHDSRGEFVFDWSWADAYERAGLHYYPKLVASVPFTPATGSRVLVEPRAGADQIAARLVEGALQFTRDLGASSLHFLFPTDAQRRQLQSQGFLARKSCQFHWYNEGYSSFDDFLATFSSAKRKKARRERRRIAEADIVFERLSGDEPSAADWEAIFEFYARTFLRRGRSPYLNRAFFDQIATTMPENLVIMLARYERQAIAVAICFRGADTLYGRYWGSLADFHSLHFEACYYQGIDYCIREGLQRFEPGTQGEHKISRGFKPTATWSCHWLSEPAFYEAVEEFVAREATHVDAYMQHLEDHLPYRRMPAHNARA